MLVYQTFADSSLTDAVTMKQAVERSRYLRHYIVGEDHSKHLLARVDDWVKDPVSVQTVSLFRSLMNLSWSFGCCELCHVC